MKKIDLSKRRVIFYYLIAICVLYFVYYFLQVLVDGKYFMSIFPIVSDNTFMDHFNSVNDAKYDPYNDKFSNYPAMACLIYKAFLAMVPAEFRGGDGFALRNTQTAMLPFIIYVVFIIWFIQMIVYKKSLLENNSKILFSVIVLLSTPMIFTLERGNLILLSFVLTMFFAFYFESENKVLRELAFIALAIFAIIVIPWASNLIPIFVGYKFPVSYTMLFYYLALCWLALLLLGEGVRVFSQKKGKICEMILFLGAGIFSVLTVVTAMLR